VSIGSVLQLPGFSEVVALSNNPNPDDGLTSRGGLRWYNDTTGALNRAYELYYSPNGQNGRFDLFAKANGLGELVARTAPPPIEIGDRVWQDTNRDGVQDAGEAGLGGLTVRLVDDAGATVSTALTD